MNMLLSKIISSLVEIVAFSAIPFLWWFCTARRKNSFFQWIGLKNLDMEKHDRKMVIAYCSLILLVFLLLSAYILNIVKNVEGTATSEFSGLGMNAVPAIIIYGIFNTALPEEILFRGFLMKRLSSKLGFMIGNIVQALLFGTMHGILFIGQLNVVKTILITLFTAGIAWFMGWINEKKANGSILPSWSIHAISNIFSGVCSAFVMF